MTKSTTAPAADRPRTSSDIEAEIATLTTTKAQAEAELGRLAAKRPGLLLDMTDAGDRALEAHDAAAAKAKRTIERAGAVLAKLQADLAAARHDERQAALRGIYTKGEAAAEEYRLRARDYETAARKAAAALAGMRAALAIVEEANRTLPEGVRAIDADAFRHPPYAPEEPPPAEIEVVEWLNAEGHVDRPILIGRDGKGASAPAGYTQRKVMRPNPARATWRQVERRRAHDLLRGVRLPGVMGDAASIWPPVSA